MPPKDDDDPASTKEVVTKKQKQLLNREELDLNLIAESLGGFVIEGRRRKKYRREEVHLGRNLAKNKKTSKKSHNLVVDQRKEPRTNTALDDLDDLSKGTMMNLT